MIGTELIKQWNTYCGGKKQILAEGISLTDDLRVYIEQFDFTIIKDISPIKFLEQFSQTNWYKYHFGGGIKKSFMKYLIFLFGQPCNRLSVFQLGCSF